jgi:hypothetical protein
MKIDQKSPSAFFLPDGVGTPTMHDLKPQTGDHRVTG